MKRRDANKKIVSRAGWVDLRATDDEDFYPYKDQLADFEEEDAGFCSAEFYEYLAGRKKVASLK